MPYRTRMECSRADHYYGWKLGLQFGGQAVDLVMIVTNDSGMEHLLSSKFKLGADASAAAGPVGRDAAADTDIKMRAEVLTYSRARGLFAGIDLNGAAMTQDKDETRVLYGKFVPFAEILNGKVPPTTDSQPFLTAIRKYSVQSKESSENSLRDRNSPSAQEGRHFGRFAQELHMREITCTRFLWYC